MGELFQVIFNSQGNNIIDSTDLSSVSYNVNWVSILGNKYKKFKCSFIFKSQDYDGAVVSNCFIELNLGSTNISNGLSRSSYIGVVSQSFYFDLSISYLSASTNDNNVFKISYPTQQSVVLNIKTLNNVLIAGMCHYVLILNLEGIDE